MGRAEPGIDAGLPATGRIRPGQVALGFKLQEKQMTTQCVSEHEPGAAGQAIAAARVSIVVPTYKEAANLPLLIERLEPLRREQGLDIELLILDDDSRDGTEELMARLDLPWVRLIVRRENRGLSAAVLDGLAAATGETVLVMDADLSHPPEAIPAMLAKLENGAEFVIGSRYVEGGATGEDWGLFRWLNSKVATWLARPFTRAADPMSGFFAFRRAALERAPYLNPVGYKIGLELLVKCGFERVVEVPIFFAQRQLGESKLSFKEQLRYLQHLRRLLTFKYPFWSHAVQFGVVGGIGVFVNLAVLTALLHLGVAINRAVLAAIAVSIVSNFALNRRFTFYEARQGSLPRQFAGFVASCSIGAAVNYAITIGIVEAVPDVWPQLASLIGIAGGLSFNFVLSRSLVFRT
jgi:dolichol-phosphate mannosyltransferase